MENSDIENLKKIDTLFSQALDYEGDIDDFLNEFAPPDPQIRSRVKTLMQASARTSALFATVSAARDALIGQKTVSPPLTQDTRLGRFRISQLIGEGGSCRVYEAFRDDERFEQRVAIKVFEAAGADQWGLKRFENERRILSSFEHPNIARIIDGGETPDGLPWLAMEFIEGDLITDKKASGTAELLSRFVDVCNAVSHAHARLIIHQDIKPGNVLIDHDGRVRLLDFGIAQLVSAEGKTSDKLLLLTPEYAAPEQMAGGTASIRTDIFQLGGLLREMLAGASPRQPLPEGADISNDLMAIIEKAMKLEPDARYGSVDSLLRDIENFQTHYPVNALPKSRPYVMRKFARRNRNSILAGSLVAGSLIAGMIGTSLFAIKAETARAAAVEAEAELKYQYEQVESNSRLVRGSAIAYQRAFADQSLEPDALKAALMKVASDVEVEYEQSPDDAQSILAALSQLFFFRNDYPATADLAERYLSLDVDENDDLTQAVLGFLARAYKEMGRKKEAEIIYRKQEAFIRTTRQFKTLEHVPTVSTLAVISEQKNDILWADEVISHVIAYKEVEVTELGRDPSQLYLSYLYNEGALMRRLLGDYDGMVEMMEKSVALARLPSNQEGTDIDNSILNLAVVKATMQGRLDEAKALVKEAEQFTAERKGESGKLATIYHLKAYFAFHDGDIEAVDENCAAGLRLIFKYYNQIEATQLACELIRAESRITIGEYTEAKTIIDAVEADLEKSGSLSERAQRTIALTNAQIPLAKGNKAPAQNAVMAIKAHAIVPRFDVARVRRVQAALDGN